MADRVPPPSEHESDILGLIAGGSSMDQLLTAGPWTPVDVATTMRRHGLAVTEGGSIVRSNVPTRHLLDVALHSESPHVRKQAARAQKQLLELQRVIGMDHAGQSARDLRCRKRRAIQAWIDWLRQAETEARGELRRLGPAKKTTGKVA